MTLNISFNPGSHFVARVVEVTGGQRRHFWGAIAPLPPGHDAPAGGSFGSIE